MKKVFSLAFLILGISLQAQKYDLGKVTVQELSEKVCPIDSSAPAAVLFNEAKTSFIYEGEEGFRIVTEIMTKIKIYKKEGYDYANHIEKYYIGGNSNAEQVVYTKAATYNLVNGKVEKTKLSGDGEFREELNKYWAVKKITMPNVKEGSIIEYKVTITSVYIQNFPTWEFQKDIPVLYSEYVTYIPEYFMYNLHVKGFLSPVSTKSDKERTIQYSTVGNALQTTSSTGRDRYSMTFKEEVSSYILENIPALKDEPYTNNINNYRSSLIHELSGTRYPGQAFKNFTTDWDTVAKLIYSNDDFGSELNKTGYYEKDIETLLTGVTDPEEKIALIFNFVKSRMNWDEFIGYSCNDGVRKAYQSQKGNSAEINLMLTSMLRFAGFTANPILLSTRGNGIAIFPSRTAFNYVICGVTFQDKMFLLDATDKHALPNILPNRALNWTGRMIQKDGTNNLISLTPEFSSKDQITLMGSIDETGKVKGKLKEMYYDYDAFRFRNNHGGLTVDSQMDRIEKNNKGIEIQNYTLQNVKDLAQPVVEGYEFEDSNSVEIIGGKLYVNPLLFQTLNENPFKQDIREFPIDFVYPNQNRYMVALTIPEGYMIESMPQPKAFAMPDNKASFKFNISGDEKNIQIILTFDINSAIVPADEYVLLKGLMAELVKLQTEKIVLKKK
ncbi:MAG: hypothetical protein RL607_1402 [Bacteroidota bacterium]|jgi:hypothetical protein